AFLVKDINDSFDTAAGSSPGRFVEARGAVFFSATYGLWRTDGTPAGTALVKSLGVSELTAVNGTLFFASRSHPSLSSPGARLWKSDGTAEGTVLVADIGP